jgi:DNA-3-methyladenine glycosylase I
MAPRRHRRAAGCCPWAEGDPVYLAYHDQEWGLPSRDERHLFEMLVLEGFQAGLSWRTILGKRQAFRRAFAGFDPARVARFGAADLRRLLGDAGIVRHRGKIEGAIRNARALRALHRRGGSLAGLAWGVVGGSPRVNRRRRMRDVPATTPESEALATALRARGFAFVGPTTAQAFLQAVGVVNDHLIGCPRHAACAAAARRFRPPSGLDYGLEIREEGSTKVSKVSRE